MSGTIVCPLCVQYRCVTCKQDDCYGECGTDQEFEPYWPDGSVAVLTQDDYCERCQQSMDDYLAAYKEPF